MKKIQELLIQLKDPDNEYRPVTFWSWNDALKEGELRRQLIQQKEHGMGGAFLHARSGLRTEYMSEEWMQCIESCLQEGEKQGFDTWLYDENGWPSGFADGEVPRRGIQYCQKFLLFREVNGAELANIAENIIAVYRTEYPYERIEAGQAKTEKKVLVAYYEVNRYYIDVFENCATDAFLETTYERYYERFGKYFGKQIPGIFTDEPQYGRYHMPWSFAFEEEFSARCGKNLTDCLAAFYFNDYPSAEKIRYDFFQMVTDIFSHNYSEKLAKWCDAHGLQFTGHVLFEDTLALQCKCSGAAMPFYQYMQQPGIDFLGNGIGNSVVPKQVVSVAQQLGKERIICEMFGGATWSIKIADLKWIAQWLYVSGVNAMCPHLLSYSIRGLRKRDWPPSIFFQMPWWDEFTKFNKYFSRVGTLSANSKQVADLLVVHPIRTAWIKFDQSIYEHDLDTNDALAELDGQFATASDTLTGLHIGYHYGDEEIIEKYGRAEGSGIWIGECRYKAILLPACDTLTFATKELLKQFLVGGGKVFYFGEFPSKTDGEGDEEWNELRLKCLQIENSADGIKKMAELVSLSRVSVTSAGREVQDILTDLRVFDDGLGLYLVNKSKEKAFDVTVRVETSLFPCLLDLETGNELPCRYNTVGNSKEIILLFEKTQAHYVIFTRKCTEEAKESSVCYRKIPLEGNYRIVSQSENCFTLDYCACRTDSGKVFSRRNVLEMQEALMEERASFNAEYQYEFNSDFGASERHIDLIVENADQYLIYVNDILCMPLKYGRFIDPSFRRVPISKCIKKGKNKIRICGVFSNSPKMRDKYEKAKIFESEANNLWYETEVESVYIVGDFSVSCNLKPGPGSTYRGKEFCLSDRSINETQGDLTTDGYPFFAGNIVLEQDFYLASIPKSVQLQLPPPNAAAVKIIVNGHEAKSLLWEPYTVDITELIVVGKNTLRFDLSSTNRNLFGHHHHPSGELTLLAPSLFTKQNGWTDEYHFIQFGLNKGARILLRR